VLAGLLAALALAAMRQAYGFLAPNAPVGARVLVVEGWLPDDALEQAAAEARSGAYERVLTTGGPVWGGCDCQKERTYADWARDSLVRAGVPEEKLVAIPAPASAQDRSFLNAVMVREWLEREGRGFDAVDVFSGAVHGRRSWLLHRMALGPGVRVGIRSAAPTEYDPAAWWRTSAGAKEVLGESIGWLWTELFFHPGAPGSREERWAVP